MKNSKKPFVEYSERSRQIVKNDLWNILKGPVVYIFLKDQ